MEIDNTKYIKEFINVTRDLDKKRNENFFDVFPELKGY